MTEPTMAEDIRVSRDIVYGSGRIQVGSTPRERALKLDIYEPAVERGDRSRPALIMAFGGAFHRGDKWADEFEQDGQRNTPVSDYCRMFARRGYVAFSIDYRLVQEDPDPGSTPVIADPHDIPMSRVAHVRSLLGLPAADAPMIWAGIEAATDDMAKAFGFVQSKAQNLGIDPERIVVGGFSAGARIALNACYGERLAAAAVVSLSGYMGNAELLRLVVGGQGLPPALLVHGENDLDYIAAQVGPMRQHFEATKVGCEAWQVTGASHFYPADSVAVRHDGKVSTVEAAVVAFVDRSTRRDRAPHDGL
ncbi:MAG: alpha/beta hydrolase [Ideonella sp.]